MKFGIDHIKTDEGYILNPIYRMIDDTIEDQIDLEEIKPNFKPYYNLGESGVIVGIRASHESKVFPPEKMVEVLKSIKNSYPKEIIYLLGTGNKQRNYAEKIVKELKIENIINLVDKISLIEGMKKVAQSKLYIGFDSGLFHAAYSFRKDIIVFLE